MKITITEMKNTLEKLNNRLDEAEDQISDLEDKVAENTQSEQQQEKRIPPQNQNSLRDFWDNIKHTNICIIGVSKGEEKKELKNCLRNNDRKLP